MLECLWHILGRPEMPLLFFLDLFELLLVLFVHLMSTFDFFPIDLSLLHSSNELIIGFLHHQELYIQTFHVLCD